MVAPYAKGRSRPVLLVGLLSLLVFVGFALRRIDRQVGEGHSCTFDPTKDASQQFTCAQDVLTHISDAAAVVVFASAMWQTMVLAGAVDLSRRGRNWTRIVSSLVAGVLIGVVYWILLGVNVLTPISVGLSIISLILVALIDMSVENSENSAAPPPSRVPFTGDLANCSPNKRASLRGWSDGINLQKEWNFCCSDDNMGHLVEAISIVLGARCTIEHDRAAREFDPVHFVWGRRADLYLVHGRGRLHARVSVATQRGLEGVLKLLTHVCEGPSCVNQVCLGGEIDLREDGELLV